MVRVFACAPRGTDAARRDVVGECVIGRMRVASGVGVGIIGVLVVWRLRVDDGMKMDGSVDEGGGRRETREKCR